MTTTQKAPKSKQIIKFTRNNIGKKTSTINGQISKSWSFRSETCSATTPEEIKYLFLMSRRFTELYPIGSIVHINKAKIIGVLEFLRGQEEGDSSDLSDNSAYRYEGNYDPVKVRSIGFPLIDKNSVGFLCSESQDNSDVYLVEDLLEWEEGKLELV